MGGTAHGRKHFCETQMTTTLLASTASAMVSSVESDMGPIREDPVSSLHTSMPFACSSCPSAFTSSGFAASAQQ
jgi:hypothetical protein